MLATTSTPSAKALSKRRTPPGRTTACPIVEAASRLDSCLRPIRSRNWFAAGLGLAVDRPWWPRRAGGARRRDDAGLSLDVGVAEGVVAIGELLPARADPCPRVPEAAASEPLDVAPLEPSDGGTVAGPGELAERLAA
jgi:hypothetical protein